MCKGFSDKAIKWFYSYLISRTFFVSLNNIFLEAGTTKCRVSQGSTVGPLLFLLYINNIPQDLSNHHAHLYAEDNSIFYQHKHVTKFVNVCNWFADDQLSIHVSEYKLNIFLGKKPTRC